MSSDAPPARPRVAPRRRERAVPRAPRDALLPYLRLVRAPAVFSALGDPIAGLLLAALQPPVSPVPALPPSPIARLEITPANYTVVAGDSLASIAYHEYGDPTMWRPLARFNEIDDPIRLRLGATLFLPAVDELLVAGG